jgi:hypothetical protein
MIQLTVIPEAMRSIASIPDVNVLLRKTAGMTSKG